MTFLDLEFFDHRLRGPAGLDAQLASETVDALQRRKPDQGFVCPELALDTTRKWTLTPHLGDYLTAL